MEVEHQAGTLSLGSERASLGRMTQARREVDKTWKPQIQKCTNLEMQVLKNFEETPGY